MASNPFLTPRRLDGVTVDPTGGRGYADDDSPGRLSRRVKRFVQYTTLFQERVNAMADADGDFDSVALTIEEQVDLEAQKQPDDLEREAAIHSPEEVIERRSRLTYEAMRRGIAPNG